MWNRFQILQTHSLGLAIYKKSCDPYSKLPKKKRLKQQQVGYRLGFPRDKCSQIKENLFLVTKAYEFYFKIYLLYMFCGSLTKMQGKNVWELADEPIS